MNKNILILILFTGFATGCTLRNPDQKHGVRVEIPGSMRSAHARASQFKSILPRNPSHALISDPTDLGDFQCFGLNILGPGIEEDPRFGCNDPSKSMGQVEGFASVEGGVIEAEVLAGADRTIQLIGVQSEIGCPSLEAMLEGQDPNDHQSMSGLGEPYLLGSAIVDIFEDVVVSITAAFDAEEKMFAGCGPPPTLTIRMQQDNYSVQSQYCAPFTVSAEGIKNSLPSMSVAVSSFSGGSTPLLYENSSCATPIVNPIVFPGGVHGVTKYVLTTAGTTTFNLQVSTAAAGYQTPEVTFTTVANRIQFSSPPSQKLGIIAVDAASSCTPINVDTYNAYNAAAVNLGNTDTFDFWVRNTDSNNTEPSIEVYLNSGDCSAGTNPVASSYANGIKTFPMTLTSTVFYIRNATVERLNIGAGKSGGFQSYGSSVDYEPFKQSGSPPTPLTGVTFGGGLLNITFNYLSGVVANVQDIMIGDQSCTSLTYNGAGTNIDCGIPANTPGSYPIKIVSGGIEHMTQYSYTYITPVTVTPAATFIFNNGVPASGALTLANGAATACNEPSGLMFSNYGISLDATCNFTGTPSATTGGPITYDAAVTGNGVTHTTTSAFTIQINP